MKTKYVFLLISALILLSGCIANKGSNNENLQVTISAQSTQLAELNGEITEPINQTPEIQDLDLGTKITPQLDIQIDSSAGEVFLNPDEAWFGNDLQIQFRNSSLDPGCKGVIGFELEVTNNSLSELSNLDLSIIDDKGSTYSNIWWKIGELTDQCFDKDLQSFPINIKSGETIVYAFRAIGNAEPSVTNYVVELSSFDNRIDKASWLVGDLYEDEVIESLPNVGLSNHISFLPIGYQYKIESGGDGWNYGSVRLAFLNQSNSLVNGEVVNFDGVYVETLEGINYPAILSYSEMDNYGNYEQATQKIDLTRLERVPPDFVVPISQILYFRIAEAATPSRIIFESIPQWSIDIKLSAQTDPAYTDIVDFTQFSSLKDLIIAEIPEKASIRLDGSCTRKGYYYSLGFIAENIDAFDGVDLQGEFGPATMYWVTEPGESNFDVDWNWDYDIELGPSQTITGTATLQSNVYYVGDDFSPIVELMILYDELEGALPTYKIIDLSDCSVVESEEDEIQLTITRDNSAEEPVIVVTSSP